MKKQIFLGLGALALLASCSNDIDSPVANVNDGYLRVNGTINGLGTRATDTDFANEDKIGVSGGSASNVLYQYNGSAFTSTEGIKLTEETGFTAYYPYSADATSGTITYDLTSSNNCDFLYAPEVEASPDSPTVYFQFAHKMSRLAFKIVDGTGELGNSKPSISLNNVATSGSFSTTTGDVTAGATKGSLTVGDAAFGTTVTKIVSSYATAPSDAIEVIVEVNNVNYTCKVNPTLQAGNQYSYTLTIPKVGSEQEEVKLVVTGGITNWDDNDGDGTLNRAKNENEVLEVGDFLLADGDVIDKNDVDFDYWKNKVVGVVYYVAEENELTTNGFPASKGLAIALKNGGEGLFGKGDADISDWAKNDGKEKLTGYNTSELSIGNGGPTKEILLGYNNTEIIKLFQEDFSVTDTQTGSAILLGYLATVNKNKVNNISWYLPSFFEFKKIEDNIVDINSSIEKAGGEQFSKKEDYDNSSTNTGFYWTSTLRGAKQAWVSVMNKDVDNTTLSLERNRGSNSGYFRFAIAF